MTTNVISNGFEVVEFTPNLRRQDKKEFLDMLELLLKVPPGKSIRKGFSDIGESKKFDANARSFLKRRGLVKTFFIRRFTEVDQDGRFYVYIGRKEGE